eukprot:10502394-Alexandrium_andersonii.AAC.1
MEYTDPGFKVTRLRTETSTRRVSVANACKQPCSCKRSLNQPSSGRWQYSRAAPCGTVMRLVPCGYVASHA